MWSIAIFSLRQKRKWRRALSEKPLDNFADNIYDWLVMMHINQITTRDLLRDYKRIVERVKRTHEPAVVVSQKEPQVAIVSLDDLEALTALRLQRSTKTLLDLAGAIPKGSGLPADLSAKHDEYTWD